MHKVLDVIITFLRHKAKASFSFLECRLLNLGQLLVEGMKCGLQTAASTEVFQMVLKGLGGVFLCSRQRSATSHVDGCERQEERKQCELQKSVQRDTSVAHRCDGKQ